MSKTSVGRNSNMNTPMITSPALELINISSSSGEELVVEPFSLPELENRFRVPHIDLVDLPTAFVEAAEAVLFARGNEAGSGSEHHVDTRGSNIENDLMDLLDHAIDVSPLSFIGSSEDEVDPFLDANFANVERSSYGRPVQRVVPIPWQQEVIRPIAIPPTIQSGTSAFTAVMPTIQGPQEPAVRQFPQANYLPMPNPFYQNSWNNGGYYQTDLNRQVNQGQQVSQGAPIINQPILQMNPSVMPEVAGYCSGCNKTYDQIAVETLTHYVAWSEYPDETIRDRNVRSRAFIDGFGAALICFKNAGLLASYPCEMSGVQHR